MPHPKKTTVLKTDRQMRTKNNKTKRCVIYDAEFQIFEPIKQFNKQ